jgi:hypothetical protein
MDCPNGRYDIGNPIFIWTRRTKIPIQIIRNYYLLE